MSVGGMRGGECETGSGRKQGGEGRAALEDAETPSVDSALTATACPPPPNTAVTAWGPLRAHGTHKVVRITHARRIGRHARVHARIPYDAHM